MNSSDMLASILADHNLRNTSFRQEVLQVFMDNRGRAMTSLEIEASLEEADRITLYRTLKSFEENGLIHQAIDGSQVNKYALCSENCDADVHRDEHAHFRCVECGETECLYHSLNGLHYKLPSGYRVFSSQVILTGVCAKCT